MQFSSLPCTLYAFYFCILDVIIILWVLGSRIHSLSSMCDLAQWWIFMGFLAFADILISPIMQRQAGASLLGVSYRLPYHWLILLLPKLGDHSEKSQEYGCLHSFSSIVYSRPDRGQEWCWTVLRFSLSFLVPTFYIFLCVCTTTEFLFTSFKILFIHFVQYLGKDSLWYGFLFLSLSYFMYSYFYL